jgi:Mg-chelatase subunit ChlD
VTGPTVPGPPVSDDDRLRRWRLVLGEADGTGCQLSGQDLGVDAALEALYGGPDPGAPRSAGLGSSAPSVTRWLGDIRTYFPTSVVKVMQRDAMERLGLRRLLLEPELLGSVQPDIHLVGTLLSLRSALPEQTRETARQVVRTVVEEIERRLEHRLHAAVRGALDRSTRTRRPRLADVDWPATIRANLKHYQPEQATIVAETLLGHPRRRRSASLRDVVLLVDQSGSMASSVVYSGVMAASLASLRSITTKLVVFDTAVVDLTEALAGDPVEVLFSTQLGGGTDIDGAVAYGASLVTRPTDTVLVLISDLIEGGDQSSLVRRLAALVEAGVTVVVLLALSDDGTPMYDHELAATCAALGAPAFACTPDLFPDLLAAALKKEDVAEWAGRAGIAVGR